MTRSALTRRGALAGAAALLAAPTLLRAQDLDEKGYALGDIALGAEDAPVTVIEYASLTCPHCGRFHTAIFPQFKADYIETGKVRFIMREVFWDRFALWGAMVARCGGAERYHPIMDALLQNQHSWYLGHVDAYQATKNPQPILDEIRAIGRRAGLLSNARMNECLSDQALLERVVGDYQENAKRDGVTGTPTLFVNGEQIDTPRSAADLAAEIERHL